jgi:hypothetical protein
MGVHPPDEGGADTTSPAGDQDDPVPERLVVSFRCHYDCRSRHIAPKG